MKKLSLSLSPLVAVLIVCAATAAQAAKIEICHRPPGNPDNWHTITINENALSAHQAHGDLVGPCSDNCEQLCDDGDLCTIDIIEPTDTECTCQVQPRPAVDCDDELSCTTDSCDPSLGCIYTEVVCEAPDLCTVSVCSEPSGTCEETPVACPTGEACNPDSGDCEALTLTGIQLVASPNGWGTWGTCGLFDLFVYDQSSTLLNDSVPGTGMTGTGLNVPLAPGTYTFTLQGDGFDNNGGSNLPATFTLHTSLGTITSTSPVTFGGFTIEVTSFTAARNGDSVSPCSEGANGKDDISATLTLQVTTP